MFNQLNFKKRSILLNNLEKIIEPYPAISFELSDNDILEKVLHGYHDAYFSCANFQLRLKTMQHSSTELQSAVTLQNQGFTIFFLQKRTLKISKIVKHLSGYGFGPASGSLTLPDLTNNDALRNNTMTNLTKNDKWISGFLHFCNCSAFEFFSLILFS